MKTRGRLKILAGAATRNFGILAMNKRSSSPLFPIASLLFFYRCSTCSREGVAHGVAMQTYGTDAPVCYAPRHMRRDFNTNSGGCTVRNTITTVSSFRFLYTTERKTDRKRTQNIARLSKVSLPTASSSVRFSNRNI